MGAGQKKKAASQCRGNIGILEHKHRERSCHFPFKSVAEKEMEKTDELLRVEKKNRGLRFEVWRMMSDTLVGFEFCLVCGAERVWFWKF